jgi:hypothetical protein
MAVASDPVNNEKRSRVSVALGEWDLTITPRRVRSGLVRIVARNVGQREHEVVVVRAGSAKALAVLPDGSADEGWILEHDRITKIKSISPGRHKTKTLSLARGDYVVMCNRVDRDGASHFAQQMLAVLNVR